MPISPAQPKILVIGDDPRLAYLLKRYAEQNGYQIIQHSQASPAEAWRQLKPAAIIFSSVEQLQTAQVLVEDFSAQEIPVLVCAAIADEPRAQELGADAFLLHPLTYDNFRSTLMSICPVDIN